MARKTFKVGDTVTAEFIQGLRVIKKKKVLLKLKVKGKITKIVEFYGRKNYTITDGVVEDFVTRNVK